MFYMDLKKAGLNKYIKKILFGTILFMTFKSLFFMQFRKLKIKH